MSHTTCDCTQAARDAETDIWPNPSAGQLLAAVIAKAADGVGLTSSLLARPGPSEPADASQPLGDVPASERPREAVLRPIDPEDVRVGMVVDIIDRARIRRVDDQRAWISDDEYTMLRRDGRSLWLVEDAPQVDEDHDLVEDIAEVISHAAPIDWDLSMERLDEDAADGLRHVARAIIERLRSQGRIEADR